MPNRQTDIVTPWAHDGAKKNKAHHICLILMEDGGGLIVSITCSRDFPSFAASNEYKAAILSQASCYDNPHSGWRQVSGMKTKQKCNVTGKNNFEKKWIIYITGVILKKRNFKRMTCVFQNLVFNSKLKVIYQNVLLFKSFKRVEARNKNERFISFHFVWKESWQTTEKDPYSNLFEFNDSH